SAVRVGLPPLVAAPKRAKYKLMCRPSATYSCPAEPSIGLSAEPIPIRCDLSAEVIAVPLTINRAYVPRCSLSTQLGVQTRERIDQNITPPVAPGYEP